MILDDRYLEMHAADDVRVKGTRVGIEHLLVSYLEGGLPEEIAVEFPTVTLEQVHGIIAWYLHNRKDVDSYLRRWHSRSGKLRSHVNKSNEPDVIQRLRRLAEEHVAG